MAKEIVCLSLDVDTVRRLDRLARHLGASRSAVAGRILAFNVPLAEDPLLPTSELDAPLDGNRRTHRAAA
jgi:hypothetical protein